MGAKKELNGQHFGKLVVVYENGRSKDGKVMWHCICECGNEIDVTSKSLISGNTKSCGCLRIDKITAHGDSKSRLYSVWKGMRRRCNDCNDSHYMNYGGKGIKVCQEWDNSYEAFRDWALENGYETNALRGECTIDRIYCNKGYEPNNCRLATIQTQENNKTTNRYLSYNGETLTMAQWAKELNIKYQTLVARIERGWSVEDALTIQTTSHRRKRGISNEE